MRVYFKDLYTMYPHKWVTIINDEWKDGGIYTCEVFGVFETEDEAYAASEHLNGSGTFYMESEDEELGFIFVFTH